MEIDDIKVLKQDERGTIYKCGAVNYILRKKDTVSADHTHEKPETLYLVEGKGELTIGEEKETIKAPVKVFVPAGQYHKLIALTDIKLIRT